MCLTYREEALPREHCPGAATALGGCGAVRAILPEVSQQGEGTAGGGVPCWEPVPTLPSL